MYRVIPIILIMSMIVACESPKKKTTETAQPSTNAEKPFVWEAANVYFLLTDRFNNGNPNNDINFNRTKESGKLRNFMGGDIKGITQKINEGYFSKLGVNAIWLTPVVEQIHGSVDEGTGNTYAFHGYWAKDWTNLDPNFGTKEDLAELVATAHAKGIRILLDVVINHTGPVTDQDPVWGEDWVRTGPQCTYDNYTNTTSCTLVANLPDILTESNENVALPTFLLDKWKAEGRLEQELKELDDFFSRTGHPRAPRFYIIKWLTDYIREFGVDGFRVDTVKHTEETVWAELYDEAVIAFAEYKKANPDKVLDDNEFYMVGEVYNYGISGGRFYDFGDKKVDYFDHGFKSLINFEMKYDANFTYDTLFRKYDTLLHTKLKGRSVLNYLSSHDDGSPFDKMRQKPYESATKLLLTPGASQIYYGDETARSLNIEGAQGDATLRSFMNWEELAEDPAKQKILQHWQKLGSFRNNHPAVGAGRHKTLGKKPFYTFSRVYQKNGFIDKVVVALDAPKGQKQITVNGVFDDGTKLVDAYSGKETSVKNGIVSLSSEFDIVLLEQK